MLIFDFLTTSISGIIKLSIVSGLMPLIIGLGFNPDSKNLGLSFWHGLMLTGIFTFLGHVLHFPKIWVLCALAIFIFIACYRARSSLRLLMQQVDLRFWFYLLPLISVAFLYCYYDPVRAWDAYQIWLARVHLLEEWQPFSRFAQLQIAQDQYPYMGAVIWWLSSTIAQVPVEAGRVVYAISYFAFFSAVKNHYRISRQETDFYLLIAFAYLLFSLQWINGYQDGFLMLAAGFAVLCLFESSSPMSWVMLAALSWIKVEGTIIAIILSICFKMFNCNSLDIRKNYLSNLLFIACLGLWPLIQLKEGFNPLDIQHDAFHINSFQILIDQVIRIPLILESMLAHWISNPAIYLPFFGLGIWRLWRRCTFSACSLTLITFVLCHHLSVIIIFWVTQSAFPWHLETAFERLMSQGHIITFLAAFDLWRTSTTDNSTRNKW